ncbi:hypothetical protein GCM10009647_088170 [Streptomyces sanglieri]
MAGHSLGGASAAATMAQDPRVRSGANLDGPLVEPGSNSSLSGRPLPMLGTKADHSPGSEDKTWDSAWKKADGWKRWATVPPDAPAPAVRRRRSDPSPPARSGRHRCLRALPQGGTPAHPTSTLRASSVGRSSGR